MDIVPKDVVLIPEQGYQMRVRQEFDRVCRIFLACRTTGLSMEFDKIHLKEAIVTGLDMHSFRYFDTFEFVKLSKRGAKMTHVILFR